MRVFVYIGPQGGVVRSTEIQLRHLGGSNDVAEIVDVSLSASYFRRQQITLLRYEVDHEAIWLQALGQFHTKFVDLVIL